ncbi:hypothetical protein COV16_06740, partial [Candidatus Woesearchaeota archaeon CG10_big_fil_rev_8_21_14_0_10_34_8]
MNKLLLLSLITILLITPIALADGLGFSDIDVEVDGDAADDVDADGGSFDAAPGDSVEITIEVQNTFDVSTEGHKIKRINVEIEVDNFCPKGLDDEINDDASLDNLDPDTDDSATFRFYIPDCAEEDNYNLDIIVEGKDDDDGTVYKISKKLLIGLEKNPTELTLDFGELEPSTVSCDRTFETTVEVHNIGTLSEDAGLLLINNDIGVNKFDFLDLKPGKWTNEDTYFEKTYEFTLDDDVEAGEYSIRAEVEYDSNSREIKRYQTIIVEDC